MTKKELREYAASIGLNMLGVAPISRFESVPQHKHPASILPEARSVIVVGSSVPRGDYRGIEDGTLWQRSSRFIEAIYMYKFARFLEDEGGIAVPSTPLAKERWPEGIKFRDGKVEPNVYPDLEYAVIACGLGEIGYCGLVITPQFGIRQSLGLIITDLEIETDEVFTGHICHRENCSKCIEGCPMDAIDASKPVQHEVCGVKYTTASVNRLKCRYCPNGTFPDTTHPDAMPNRLAAACSRACMVHLEESGLVQNNLKTPFCRRKAWGFNLDEL